MAVEGVVVAGAAVGAEGADVGKERSTAGLAVGEVKCNRLESGLIRGPGVQSRLVFVPFKYFCKVVVSLIDLPKSLAGIA